MNKLTHIDRVAKGVVSCGFCSTENHATCKGGYRNGDGSVLICACQCADDKPVFCHHCKTTDLDNLGRPWLCDDREACEGRLRARLSKTDFYQQILVHNSVERKTGRSASCVCCGEPTRGGKFLPGHDSSWLKALSMSVLSGKLAESDALRQVSVISPALAIKLQKRLG